MHDQHSDDRSYGMWYCWMEGIVNILFLPNARSKIMSTATEAVGLLAPPKGHVQGTFC